MSDGIFSELESESIEIIREVAATAAKPVMLYSIGKDSSVMLRLAQKAFYPGPIPFPLMHIDTGWKFREMIVFRDRTAREIGFKLITYTNPRGVAEGIGPITHGSAYHTDVMKTEALKQALDLHGFDVAFGGARRDEENPAPRSAFFLSRAGPSLGAESPAPGTVESLQYPNQLRRNDSGISALQLDRSRRLAVHSPGEHSDRAVVLRRRASSGQALRSVDPGR